MEVVRKRVVILWKSHGSHEVVLGNSVMGDAIVVQSTYTQHRSVSYVTFGTKDGAGLPAHVFHKLCSWLDGTSSGI
jgi:hypothetical protein